MTLAQIGDFRLQTILKFNPQRYSRENPSNAFETQPISYGLALEAKTSKSGEPDNYVVIAFLRPKEDTCDMESVGDRFFEYVKTKDDLDIIRYLYDYGCRCIAQSEGDDQD